MIEAHIYIGGDTANPDAPVHEDVEYVHTTEHLPRDYAWRALGQRIARGPEDVPQTIDAAVEVGGQLVRVRATLTYVDVDVTGTLRRHFKPRRKRTS